MKTGMIVMKNKDVAVLENSEWKSTNKELAAYLNAFHEPTSDPSDGIAGSRQLFAAGKEMKATVHLQAKPPKVEKDVVY